MGRVRLLPASPLVSPWCFLSSQLCSLAPAHSYYQLTSSWHDSAWSWLGRGGFLSKGGSLGVWYLLTSLRSLRLDLLGAGVRKFSPACQKGLPYGGSLALEHGELQRGVGCLPRSAAITKRFSPSLCWTAWRYLTQNCPLLPVADSSSRCS